MIAYLEVIKRLKKHIHNVFILLTLVDKTALKLEKNRESARKARQRKNFYIKLLENQVVALKKQLTQSESVMNLSKKHLSTLMALKS